MEPAAHSEYDVIVIGGGPPGEVAAEYAIKGSERTAVIVEKELLGGECSYWACMPSKALLRPATVLDLARAMPGVSQLVGDRALDVRAVLGRRDAFTHGRDDSSQVEWAHSAGIDVLRGTGALAGPRQVQVVAADGSGTVLAARQAVVLATGTTASVPDVPGLRAARPWTSRDVTNLQVVPDRVAVIGGGVVACESAVWLQALGAEVTIIELGSALLARNEPFAGELVAQDFRDRGTRVLLGATLERVQRSLVAPPGAAGGVGLLHGGEVTLIVDGDQIVVDEVVVATGRTPASAGLGLEGFGLPGKGFIEVDDHLTVPGHDWLYVVGDLNGRALLTHMGKYQARIAGDVIAARCDGRDLLGSRFVDRADHDQIPLVTFTTPEVASVGLTERTAREQGRAVRTVEVDLAALAGTSLARDAYIGRAKLVIDPDSDVLLGATFVGTEVAELVHSATVAIVGAVTLDRLWHAVPSYPTISEVWLRLLEQWRSA